MLGGGGEGEVMVGGYGWVWVHVGSQSVVWWRGKGGTNKALTPPDPSKLHRARATDGGAKELAPSPHTEAQPTAQRHHQAGAHSKTPIKQRRPN